MQTTQTKTPACEKAIRDNALALLARREHSTLELHHKLTRRGFDSPTVLQVLAQLRTDGWLNEQRYAEVYACSRADKGYGPLRIQRELRERGIDDGLIQAVLRPLDDLWHDNLVKLCEKRLQPAKSKAEQAKQQRFLRHRGFTFEQINHIFK